MTKFAGIPEALAALKPYMSEIEADFDRMSAQYSSLAATDHDAIGRILKVHLIIEHHINIFIANFFEIEGLEELRLTFSQKAKMLPVKKSAGAALVRPGIIEINAVRNKFGHHLNHRVEFQHVRSMMSILDIARPGSEFLTPIEAIEAFAPIACVFLSIPPKHLKNAFAEAFSHVRVSPSPLDGSESSGSTAANEGRSESEVG